MKKALFFLLVGAAAGAYGFFYLQRQDAEKAAAEKDAAQKAEHAGKSPTLSERVRSDVFFEGQEFLYRLTKALSQSDTQ